MTRTITARTAHRADVGHPSRRTTIAVMIIALLLPLLTGATPAPATGEREHTVGGGAAARSYVTTRPGRGRFPLVAGGAAAPIVVSQKDHPGVVRVVDDLQSDIEKVTGVRPDVVADEIPAPEAVIVGTIGRSPLIDGLVDAGKLDVEGIAGRWETSLQQVVADPLPGVRSALIIAGSDQRGTIYGAYDVSEHIGVSPWYFWDDVPPRQADQLYVLPGRHTQGTPAVKYRGFFINDENPQLGRWVPNFFGPGRAEGFPGGFNADFYAKVFETMLRLKANYLWPAVWGRAFAEDDPTNHATAKEYGVAMGTSHEAPMMRGIEEWNRHATPAVRDSDGTITEPGSDPYGGTGEWSFVRNRDAIVEYWRDGIRRMEGEDFEGVVTLGMRGAGDVSLPDGDGIELMEEILATQRQVLEEESDEPLEEIPQVWTLYKEVQRYWDQGLRAPDDVTVVFTDDNWGNMVQLPDPDEERSGGYGLYYHFDYVGDGRNYKWVDTNLLPNIWEQLRTSYEYGIERLWIVNVGDMKNAEMPLEFFLDYAWDPESIGVDDIDAWQEHYATRLFGPRYAGEIADLLHEYEKLQSDRKPELLNRRITIDGSRDIATDENAVVYDDQETPFYLEHYRELSRVTDQWQKLARRAARLGERVPDKLWDAYYQLVYYQIVAGANVYEIREAEFTNLLYAEQGRAATNRLADETDAHFAEDQAMSEYYNTELAGGKWEGFQTQPKLGYGDVERYGPNAPWQQPEKNHEALPDEVFPPPQRIEVPESAEMGVAIDGTTRWWPDADEAAVLPAFSPYQTRPQQYIEVFNRGTEPFTYTIEPAEPWVKVARRRGEVDDQVRAEVSIDWRRAPEGTSEVPITITGSEGTSVEVTAVVEHPDVSPRELSGFVEAGGYVSMAADHYTRAVETEGVSWKLIPDIGRTGNGMTPWPPVNAQRTPGGDGPRLEYDMTLFTTGPVEITAYLSPRNAALPWEGLAYAVSIDDAEPQIVDVIAETGADPTPLNKQWERLTSENVNRTTTTHVIDEPGRHTVKFWMVDPTVILQNLVVDTGGLEPSYLGPPESLRVKHRVR